MQLVTLPLADALRHILRHNIAGLDGRKALSKGTRLNADDISHLRELGYETVSVAVLEAGDVHEDAAAARLADAIDGPNIVASRPSHSRINMLAAVNGVVQVQAEVLLEINSLEGLTVATLPTSTLARARQRIATIKIIPFAVPESVLQQAEAIARQARPVLALRALRSLAVGVILVGSEAAQPRLERTLLPPIQSRVTELGSTIQGVRVVTGDERAISEAIEHFRAAQAGLIIIAGETSIMDRDDVTPRGIRQAGGRIEHYGAPVEPGNLLLMAYLDDLPVLGAPGCVRSRSANIVDLLLPRLLAGERIRARDIIALGHGGLLPG
ncbi:MAG TPA: molybdopterin-binding protein [Roseiflexaceae bacterium]|nr:molybdopterin-binding protein [Roseiflexaceae bacterium]